MTNETRIKEIAESHIEILVDQNLRDDGIVKPLADWPEAHLLELKELVADELKSRKETRPFWV